MCFQMIRPLRHAINSLKRLVRWFDFGSLKNKSLIMTLHSIKTRARCSAAVHKWEQRVLEKEKKRQKKEHGNDAEHASDWVSSRARPPPHSDSLRLFKKAYMLWVNLFVTLRARRHSRSAGFATLAPTEVIEKKGPTESAPNILPGREDADDD